MTNEQIKRLITELRDAQADINAVRVDMERYPSRYGPFSSLLERAAVHVEHVVTELRIG